MEKHIAKSKSGMAEAGGQGGHTPTQITQIMAEHIAKSESGMAEAGVQGGHTPTQITQIMAVPGSGNAPH